MPLRVALTGASGLIGSHTAQALATAGHRVQALVRPASRREPVSPWVEAWCVGSFHDPPVLARLVAGADALIHCAIDWDLQATSELPDIERNVMGSLRLLEAARLAGVGQFIFVSSAAAARTPAPEAGGVVTESTAAYPACPYGACKAAVEAYLMAYHARFGMNTSAWRPAAVYGLHPVRERSRWFELLQQARHGALPPQTHIGHINSVQDVAAALCLAVGDGQVAGQLYNLAEGPLAWQAVADWACEITGARPAGLGAPGARDETADTAAPVATPHTPPRIDHQKALAFFGRHGNTTALRRGPAGARAYLEALHRVS